jgi:hypothetical protein
MKFKSQYSKYLRENRLSHIQGMYHSPNNEFQKTHHKPPIHING